MIFEGFNVQIELFDFLFLITGYIFTFLGAKAPLQIAKMIQWFSQSVIQSWQWHMKVTSDRWQLQVIIASWHDIKCYKMLYVTKYWILKYFQNILNVRICLEIYSVFIYFVGTYIFKNVFVIVEKLHQFKDQMWLKIQKVRKFKVYL